MDNKKLYTIFYNDGTFISYKLSDLEYGQFKDVINRDLKFVSTEIGIILVRDIRAIILQVEVPEENKGANPDLSEEEKEWISVAEHAAFLAREDTVELDVDEDDSDYKGGLLASE